MADRRRLRRDWPAIVAAQRDSGVSATAYCSEHGINRGLFYRWRRRLSRGSGEMPDAGFVEVCAVESRGDRSGVTLVSPSGWRVEVEAGFDVGTLSAVCASLADQSACCR